MNFIWLNKNIQLTHLKKCVKQKTKMCLHDELYFAEFTSSQHKEITHLSEHISRRFQEVWNEKETI